MQLTSGASNNEISFNEVLRQSNLWAYLFGLKPPATGDWSYRCPRAFKLERLAGKQTSENIQK